MWQWLRRLIPDLNSLAAMSWLGYAMPPLYLLEEIDSPDEDGELDSEPAVGPPPGHPERLADGRPLTPAERELWARLLGTNW